MWFFFVSQVIPDLMKQRYGGRFGWFGY